MYTVPDSRERCGFSKTVTFFRVIVTDIAPVLPYFCKVIKQGIMDRRNFLKQASGYALAAAGCRWHRAFVENRSLAAVP